MKEKEQQREGKGGGVPVAEPTVASPLQVLGEDASGLSRSTANARPEPLCDAAGQFYRDVRIGDIVWNGWASDDNPTRYMVVAGKFRRPGRFNAGNILKCIAHDGKSWDHRVDMQSRLAVVGHVRITEVLEAMIGTTHN